MDDDGRRAGGREGALARHVPRPPGRPRPQRIDLRRARRRLDRQRPHLVRGRRDRHPQRPGAWRRDSRGAQHARQDRLGGQRREMADRGARAPRAVLRIRSPRLPHVRPARQDPARDGEDRGSRTAQDRGHDRRGCAADPPRGAPRPTQRDQRRLLGFGRPHWRRHPQRALHDDLRHIARGRLDGARARVAVRPSPHPARLALGRPSAGQEAAAAREPMSSYVPGLEGIVASQTAISMVDGQNGRLVYQGYVIADLAEQMSFEEVAFLLWEGRLPTRAELDALSLELGGSRKLTQPANITLDALPEDTDPMDVLRSVVSVQGVEHKLKKPTIPLAIHATGSIPTILAMFYRRQLGLEPIKPRPDLGHAANYLYMMDGKEPAPERVHALNTYLVLLADHGMNASTFTARVIASTDSDLTSCLVGGIGALKGPAHGGAPSAVIEQMEEIEAAGDAERWMRDARKRKVKFMGFGHRVYRVYDPRAAILKQMCERMNPKFYELATRVEEIALRILHEEHPERPQSTNVEFYSAGVLQAIGLPREYFTPTFAVARVTGWSAHVLEQVANNRIIRPQSEYIGPEPRKPVPLADRV